MIRIATSLPQAVAKAAWPQRLNPNAFSEAP
jgi:hypothetical protein